MITCMKCGKSYETQPGVVCGFQPLDEDGAIQGIACTSSIWCIAPDAPEPKVVAAEFDSPAPPMSKRR